MTLTYLPVGENDTYTSHRNFTGTSPELRSSTRKQGHHSPDADKVVAEEDSVTGNVCVGQRDMLLYQVW